MSAAAALTTRQRIAWLLRYWRPHGRFALGLVMLTLISSAIAIAYPLVFREVIDSLQGDGGLDDVRLFHALGIFALVLLGRLVVGFYPGFRAWMNNIIEKSVRERVFGSILAKDYTFFGKFRTGDLVRYSSDGNLLFLGRTDQQVKLRGFRIELGEIETTLRRHPQIREAVALVHQQPNGHRVLIAYLLKASDALLTEQDMRDFAGEYLPVYM